MQKKTLAFMLMWALTAGSIVVSQAQSPTATTPPEQLKECMAQRKTGAYRTAVKTCILACRLRKNHSQVQANRCQDAYNAFRQASGQSVDASTMAQEQSFELEKLTANFSLRNGRLNHFRLVGENPELAQRAANVCIFKLPASTSSGSHPQFQAQFNDKIRAIRSQGHNVAYQLSGISWSENGRATHYPCSVEHVDVVAVPSQNVGR